MSQCAEVSENERELRASMQTQLTELKVHDIISSSANNASRFPPPPHTHIHIPRKSKVNRYKRSTNNWHHSKISESIIGVIYHYHTLTHSLSDREKMRIQALQDKIDRDRG